MKALALVKYGTDDNIFQLRKLVETDYAEFAIYPIGTEFNKDMLKEFKAKVVEIEITFNLK